ASAGRSSIPALRTRTRADASLTSAVDLGPQGAAHAEQLDEALGLLHAPVGRLGVGRALGVEDVRRTDRHRVHAATAGLEDHLAVDLRLRRSQEGFQVGLERVVVEAFVHQLHPLARHFRLETVLLLGQHRLFQRAVRGQQRGQAGGLEHDAALQADHGVAGVHAAADAVLGEHGVEAGQDLRAFQRLAVQLHRLALDELQGHLQRLDRPGRTRRAQAAGAFAGHFPLVDPAAGHGHAPQAPVDGVALLLGTHLATALLEVLLLVGAGLGVLLLDLADRGDDAVVALRLDRQVEADLVVAHAGAAVGDGIGAQLGGALERGIDDQVAVGDQQRVLALVALAGLHERFDEAVPDRLAAVDGDVAGHAQFR